MTPRGTTGFKRLMCLIGLHDWLVRAMVCGGYPHDVCWRCGHNRPNKDYPPQ